MGIQWNVNCIVVTLIQKITDFTLASIPVLGDWLFLVKKRFTLALAKQTQPWPWLTKHDHLG